MELWSIIQFGLMVLVAIAMLVLFIYVGASSADQDSAIGINKQIGIIAGVTTGLSFIFGILTFLYFNVNTDYVTPFLLISNSVNTTLALIAVGISSLRIKGVAQQ